MHRSSCTTRGSRSWTCTHYAPGIGERHRLGKLRMSPYIPPPGDEGGAQRLRSRRTSSAVRACLSIRRLPEHREKHCCRKDLLGDLGVRIVHEETGGRIGRSVYWPGKKGRLVKRATGHASSSHSLLGALLVPVYSAVYIEQFDYWSGIASGCRMINGRA